MKTRRTTRLLAHLAPLTLALALAASVGGCANEDDPKTWVKRLDDPAQRSAAVKRISSFFDDTMGKTNKNRDAPEMKALLDDIVPALTKTYVSVALDEKTRKDVMKVLGDTHDPRSAPALAKAFNEYEAGSSDDDVKFAAQSVIALANEGKLTDQSVIDGLWSCFAKFQPSKVKLITLVQSLHDAVLAVHDPSYGPKAVLKIGVPVSDPNDPDQGLDQIQFWQQTSIQLLGELKFAPAARALATVVLTPKKAGLRATANAALLKIPTAAEPVLIGAVKQTDPEFTKLVPLFEDKSYEVVACDSLSWLSRPAGKAAIIETLAATTNDQDRALIAMSLGHYPPSPDVIKAFEDAYKKIPANTKLSLQNDANAHGLLAQVVAQFYQPSQVDWMLKEVATAKGPEAYDLPLSALDSAIKLMGPRDVAKVGDAVKSAKISEIEKALTELKYKLAADVVNKCKENTSCYVDVVGQPVPESAPDVEGAKKLPAQVLHEAVQEAPVKAAWMAAELGVGKAAEVRNALLDKLPTVKHAGARLAVVEAIDALAPGGDASAADKLDKLVAADKATGDKNLAMGDDAVVKVAGRLRARSLP